MKSAIFALGKEIVFLEDRYGHKGVRSWYLAQRVGWAGQLRTTIEAGPPHPPLKKAAAIGLLSTPYDNSIIRELHPAPWMQLLNTHHFHWGSIDATLRWVGFLSLRLKSAIFALGKEIVFLEDGWSQTSSKLVSCPKGRVGGPTSNIEAGPPHPPLKKAAARNRIAIHSI